MKDFNTVILIILSRSSVICYLTTFVLDDIGIQGFRNIVKSLDIKKMHTVRQSISEQIKILELERNSHQKLSYVALCVSVCCVLL